MRQTTTGVASNDDKYSAQALLDDSGISFGRLVYPRECDLRDRALFSIVTYIEAKEVRHVYFACALVFVALIFDVLDGRIARWRQKASLMVKNSTHSLM